MKTLMLPWFYVDSDVLFCVVVYWSS